MFLVGSVLAGLSADDVAADRLPGVQGLGAGGLMVLAQAIIGDIVSPRERGRYQGYFGAVFGAGQRRRPAARRLLHRPPVVALDLLHQPAARAIVALVVIAVVLDLPVRPPRALDRLPRRRRCWSAPVSLAAAGRVWGGTAVRVGARRRSRPGRGRRACSACCFVWQERRARRADPAAAAVPQPRVRGRSRDVGFVLGVGDVRRDHVPAAVPAGGERGQRHQLRPAAAAADGRA